MIKKQSDGASVVAPFAPTAIMVSAAQAVFLAMAHLQLVQPIVLAYKERILADGQWVVRPKFAPRLGAEVITSPDRAYLMSDDNFVTYDRLCKQARDAAKLHVSHPDHCPLLEAQSMLASVQNVLIDAMSDITQIKAEKILSLGIEQRAKFIELALRLLAPFVSAR
jgi:hypothetical protein